MLPLPLPPAPTPRMPMPLPLRLPLRTLKLLPLSTLTPPERDAELWQHRVSRLGRSSACSSSRSCIVTAGRVDMDPPLGVICLGRADRACPRPRVPGSLGPARHPCGTGPEPSVRLSTYIVFGYHRTVLFTRGSGKGLRIATRSPSDG